MIDQLVTDNPAVPMQKSQRYGNPAFRTFYTRLQDQVEAILTATLCEMPADERRELAHYLLGSFGNPVRIDYGTGHELSFLAFLAAWEVGGRDPLADSELQAVGLLVLQRYLQVVRRIQTTFSLEPAGSHGVWGLDDHQFVPYIWGSAQLVGAEATLPPAAVTNVQLVRRHAADYHYLQAIEYIYQVKGEMLAEHSPLLYDISGLPDWERLNRGLVRMYRDEVLHKFPVVQHFEFGRLLPWTR